MGSCCKNRIPYENGNEYKIHRSGVITQNSTCECGYHMTSSRTVSRWVVSKGYSNWDGTSLVVVAEFDNKRDAEAFIEMKKKQKEEEKNAVPA